MGDFSSAPVLAVAISPDGKAAVAATGDRSLGVVRIRCDRSNAGSFSKLSSSSAKFVDTSPVSSLCYPSEGTLYSATIDGSFSRYSLGDPETERPHLDYEVSDVHGVGGELTGITAVSKSSVIVTCGKDATVRCWDPETRQSVARLTGHKYEVRGVAAAESESGNGSGEVVNIIASAGRDKTVRLWDVRASESNPVFVFSGHTGWVHDVAISGGGGRNVVVSCAGDKTVRVWDLGMMRQAQVFTGHEYRVWGVAVSSDGGFAISGSTDTTVRVWDLNGQPKAENEALVFEGHRDSVISVAVCRDGTAALSGCEDGSLFVWNTSCIFGRSSELSGDSFVPADPEIPEPPTPKPALIPVSNSLAAGVGFSGDSKAFDSASLQCFLLRPDINGPAVATDVETSGAGLKTTPLNSIATSLGHGIFTEIRSDIASCSLLAEGAGANPSDLCAPGAIPSEASSAASQETLRMHLDLQSSLRQVDSEASQIFPGPAARDIRIEQLELELEATRRLAANANARAAAQASFSNNCDDPESQSGSATNPEADRFCSFSIADRLRGLSERLDAMLAS